MDIKYCLGKPCKYGHSGLRYKCDYSCVECKKQSSKVWYAGNKDRKYILGKLWSANNPEKQKVISKRWTDIHGATRAARRRSRLLEATPKWANLDYIEYFYIKAKFMTWFTGVPHDVDHIIPLKGKDVCGLHVENNLQVIPHLINIQKGNKYYEKL